MIAFVRGRLASLGVDHAVVDVGGIGYAVYVTQRFLGDAPKVGTELTLYTVLVHREDAMQLFGFPTVDQREMFTLLTSVSGVGNKMALAMLGTLSTADLVGAVLGNQPKRIAQAPGVGLKTAQRLIIELKEKLSVWRDDIVLPDDDGDRPLSSFDDTTEEAVLALQALGYVPQEIHAALKAIKETDLPTEAVIRKALEWLALVGR